MGKQHFYHICSKNENASLIQGDTKMDNYVVIYI